MLIRVVIILLICITVVISCKKEMSCEDCIGSNIVPVANAGPDLRIQLPKDSMMLDGSASTDKDGRIISWSWKQLSGPNPSSIARPSDSVSIVKGLIAGVFDFELTVTDNGGLTAKDTVSVTVSDHRIPNRAPIANAGNDTTIFLPSNSTVLDGSNSIDPDNNIAGYQWTQIDGSTICKLQNSNSVKTEVSALAEGLYRFSLKVTDSGGLAGLDTLTIMVSKKDLPVQVCGETGRPVITARLVPIGRLSQPRHMISSASVAGKIIFAGGTDNYTVFNDVVDIYDVSSNTWSTAKLSKGRFAIGTVSSATKAYFAGGEIGDGTQPVDNIDIYDAVTNSWSVSHLSIAGNSVIGVAVGDKMMFCGGDGGFTGPGREKRLDIFDQNTGKWSVVELPEAKLLPGAVAVGDKVYFAGGETWLGPQWLLSANVNIYDIKTGLWTSSSLTEKKMAMAGIAVGDQIFWAGGLTGSPPAELTSSCIVNIFDANSGQTTVANLSRPESWFSNLGQTAVLKNNKIVFFHQNNEDNRVFDIYDLRLGTWTIGVVDIDIRYSTIVSWNNEIYIAGGQINGSLTDQVWKLEF